jgi:hypothetical protein
MGATRARMMSTMMSIIGERGDEKRRLKGLRGARVVKGSRGVKEG